MSLKIKIYGSPNRHAVGAFSCAIGVSQKICYNPMEWMMKERLDFWVTLIAFLALNIFLLAIKYLYITLMPIIIIIGIVLGIYITSVPFFVFWISAIWICAILADWPRLWPEVKNEIKYLRNPFDNNSNGVR